MAVPSVLGPAADHQPPQRLRARHRATHRATYRARPRASHCHRQQRTCQPGSASQRQPSQPLSQATSTRCLSGIHFRCRARCRACYRVPVTVCLPPTACMQPDACCVLVSADSEPRRCISICQLCASVPAPHTPMHVPFLHASPGYPSPQPVQVGRLARHSRCKSPPPFLASFAYAAFCRHHRLDHHPATATLVIAATVSRYRPGHIRRRRCRYRAATMLQPPHRCVYCSSRCIFRCNMALSG